LIKASKDKTKEVGMKTLFGTVVLTLALLVTSLGSPPQVKVPDFSGTWVFKSGKNPNKVTSFRIAQTDAAIEITETHKPKAQQADRVLTYYSDGRGESNPTSDGKSELKSRSKWEGETLTTLFDSFSKQPGIVNERRDDWTISKDGKTLTITTTFAVSGPPIGASNPFGSPRPSASHSKIFHVVEKRVFRKQL
jgi:hypothetical protein